MALYRSAIAVAVAISTLADAETICKWGDDHETLNPMKSKMCQIDYSKVTLTAGTYMDNRVKSSGACEDSMYANCTDSQVKSQYCEQSTQRTSCLTKGHEALQAGLTDSLAAVSTCMALSDESSCNQASGCYFYNGACQQDPIQLMSSHLKGNPTDVIAKGIMCGMRATQAECTSESATDTYTQYLDEVKYVDASTSSSSSSSSSSSNSSATTICKWGEDHGAKMCQIDFPKVTLTTATYIDNKLKANGACDSKIVNGTMVDSKCTSSYCEKYTVDVESSQADGTMKAETITTCRVKDPRPLLAGLETAFSALTCAMKMDVSSCEALTECRYIDSACREHPKTQMSLALSGNPTELVAKGIMCGMRPTEAKCTSEADGTTYKQYESQVISYGAASSSAIAAASPAGLFTLGVTIASAMLASWLVV